MYSKVKTSTKIGHCLLRNVVWVLFLGAIIAMFCMDRRLFSLSIISNIVTQSATLGVLTMAQAYALLQGEIDLSIVGNMAFSAGLGVTLMLMGLPWPLTILFIIVFSGLIGGINGLLITKLKANSLITTMAMGILLQGALLALTKGVTITGFPEGYTYIGKHTIGKFSLLIFPFIALYIVMWFVWNKTAYGRSVYAVGGNRDCARLCGINVEKTMVKTYVIGGLCAGLGGYLLSCYISAVTASFGEGKINYTLAAAVIGGLSLRGGKGKILGLIGGVFLITLMDVGLQTLGVSAYYTGLVQGIMIIVAVIFDAIKNKVLD